MNIRKPQTFSEKLQWMKSRGDIVLKTRLADKFDVRGWIEERIGAQYLVDLLPLGRNGEMWVTDADNIDFGRLPNEFVLKLTKGSGYNIICRDKGALDIEATRRKLKGWLKVDNYYLSREPQYKGQNKVICERMLEFNITDYKFFCFDGVPHMFKIDVDRFTDHHANWYDIDWNLLDLSEGCCPRDPEAVVERPAQWDEMVDVARRLSEGFPFVRVDLYVHDGRVYFGEMTFFPSGGYSLWDPHEWDVRMGRLIKL